MLLIGVFTLLLAIALYSRKITTTLINRITIILLIYSSLLSYNTIYPTIINEELGIYGNLFHVTSISQSFDLFIFIVGGTLLLLNEYPFRFYPKPEKIQETICIIEINPVAAQDVSIRGSSEKESRSEILNKQSDLITAKLNSLISLRTIGEYPVIILFSIIGGSLLMSSNDLVSMYLSIELQSFSLYILASIYRDSESATFGGLKYFLLGGLSSGFILLGCSLVYGFSGLTNFDMIYMFLLVNDNLVSSLTEWSTINLSLLPELSPHLSGLILGNSTLSLLILQVALLIIFIGFLFKIAAAPFHNWAPDVYDGVPTKVTAWLTIVPKISILIFLLSLKTKVGFPINEIESLETIFQSKLQGIQIENYLWVFQLTTSLLIISASLSLVIGTILGLSQHKIKRLLAYSTVSHVGFILLALAVFTEESVESFIFYIIQYTITNINIFFIILAFGYLIYKPANITGNEINLTYYNDYPENERNKEENSKRSNAPLYSPISYISQLRGQYKLNPILSFNFAIAIFSMAGIPPLVGFFAKQMVLSSAIQEGYLFVTLIAILASVISAAYYLRIVKYIFFDNLPSFLIQSAETLNSELDGSSALKLTKTTENNSTNPCLNYIHCYIIALSSMFILLFLINPTIILNSVHLLTLNLFFY